MNTNDIKKMMEAYLEVVSEKKHVKKESDKLDPVNDKENDKKFKDRKDKDIDNDGDVDGSDEYLHKRRKATDDAIDGGDKPADNADDGEEKEKDDKKKVAANKKGKTAEISKIGEKAVKKEDIDQLLDALDEAQHKASAKPKGDEAEEIMDKESPKGNKMKKDHEKSDPDHEKHQEKAVDVTTKAGNSGKEAPKRPGDNKAGDKNVVNPVKEDTRTFQQKIMDVLSGKSMGEITQEDVDMLKKEDQ